MEQKESTSPLRFPQGHRSPFTVALYEPEIPLNVGSVARTCACTGTPLNLVGRLGFQLDNRLARRAGLDYWEHAEVTIHATWEDFQKATEGQHMWLFSTKGKRSYWDIEFHEGDVLVFGSERTGLPDAILESNVDFVLTIPMLPELRSLNMSNTVALVLYEALRQQFRD